MKYTLHYRESLMLASYTHKSVCAADSEEIAKDHFQKLWDRLWSSYDAREYQVSYSVISLTDETGRMIDWNPDATDSAA